MSDEWDWFESLPNAAQEEINALRALASEVAEIEPYYRDQPEGWYCVGCGGWAPYDSKAPGSGQAAFPHSDDCLIVRARAVLAREDAE